MNSGRHAVAYLIHKIRKGMWLGMRVLVTSQGDSIESLADNRFGRAAYFVIFDENTKEPKIMRNPGFSSDHGAALVASQVVSAEQVDVVITGHLGPNATSSLQAAGVRAYRLPADVTVKATYEAFLAEQLESLLVQ